MIGLRTLDRYALRLTAWPLLGSLCVTLAALLLERVLRLLEMLSLSNNRFGFVLELSASLAPHYIGLALPASFCIALFIVAARLNDGAEIDVMMASGQSLTRLTLPYIALGLVMMVFGFALFGFVQPYSRYAYRAVLHAAESAGWEGDVPERTVVSTSDGFALTAESTDAGGAVLRGIFVRQLDPDKSERITTARSATIRVDKATNTAILDVQDGQELRFNSRGDPLVLTFAASSIEVPLVSVADLPRARGSDERELTSLELLTADAVPGNMIPKGALMAEFYDRLARSLTLPLLPLLAIPLGLAAKRSGRAPGVIIAGIVLVAFQHLLQLGHGLAERGKMSALLAVGVPFFVFAALCFWIFLSSRERPGDTPVSRIADWLSAMGERVRRSITARRRAHP